jgi:hypothetical protein
LLTQTPTDGIDDVALATAIGANDGRHTGIEDELGAFGKGFEALNDNTLDEHKGRKA